MNALADAAFLSRPESLMASAMAAGTIVYFAVIMKNSSEQTAETPQFIL